METGWEAHPEGGDSLPEQKESFGTSSITDLIEKWEELGGAGGRLEEEGGGGRLVRRKKTEFTPKLNIFENVQEGRIPTMNSFYEIISPTGQNRNILNAHNANCSEWNILPKKSDSYIFSIE